MPVINIPTVVSVDQRQKLFLINTDNMPSFSEINHSVEVVALEIPTEAATAPKVKRAYEKKPTNTIKLIKAPLLKHNG